jgi:hypothetical protein
MKTNGFRPIYIMIGAVILLVLGSVYLNHKSGNEMKNDLTVNTPEKKQLSLKELIKQNLKAQEQMGQKSNDAPLPPGFNLLTRERIYTEEEITSMSVESFNELLSETERRLPKKADLKELPPGALHQTPPALIEAGRNLGVIKEAIKSHPDYEKLATPFYKKCSLDKDAPTTVQALCLTNLILINKKNKTGINLNDYPKDVVNLSKMVTDL